MGKLSKAFKAIGILLKKPALLNNVLHDKDVMKELVAGRHKMPDGLPVVDLLEIVPSFNETVHPYSFLDGTSSPLDLALLRALAKQHTDCRYFEIGTWRGESAANVAAVAKECVTLNLPDGDMRRMGLREEYISMHRFYSKDLPNVKHLQHNSLTFDYRSAGKFDVIFVDGDHHYENVKQDTANVFSLLKDDDSVIVWHDYVDHSGQVRYEVLAGILDGTPAEHRPNIYHVSNTMCALHTKKKVKTFTQPEFPYPDKKFNVNISVKSLAGFS
jgi:predicted O-methyltransferase YrrM